MSSIDDESAFFDDDQTRDNALAAWTIADIESRQGLGLRLWRGATPPIWGRNGVWRMKGALGAIVGLAVLEVVLAGAGHALPLWPLILAGPHVSSAARSLDGTTSPWRRARAEGKGIFRAFGFMCAAQAKNLLAHSMLNTSTPLLMASGATEMSLAFAARILAPKGKGPLAAPLAAATKRASDFGLSVYDGRWAVGEARKASKMEQALMLRAREDIAMAAYRRLAMAHLSHSLLLDSFGKSLPTSQAQEILGPVRWKVRHALKPMLSSNPCEPDDLKVVLDLVDATQTPPWWRPTPQTPPIAELAKKLRAWQKIKSAPESPLDQRISGLLAACESHLLGASLPPRSDGSPPPARRASRI